MEEQICGKVARILNSREIVINVGAEDSVKLDMYFDVMDSKGENIRDPDTGEILGSIDRPKVRVKVISVFEKMSIASTYKSRSINIGGSALSLTTATIARSLMPAKYVNEYETLKTDEKTWEDLDESESYVNTGDVVRQVIPVKTEEAE